MKKKDILFIEASKEFVPGKAQNSMSEKILKKFIKLIRIEKQLISFLEWLNLRKLKKMILI